MLNKIYFGFALIILPVFASAGTLGVTETILGSAKSLVTTILIPLVFTLALLFFFWGVAKYIWSEGQGKEDGRKIMIWGVVALFVMTSVWGLVAFFQTEFNITGSESPMQIPNVN